MRPPQRCKQIQSYLTRQSSCVSFIYSNTYIHNTYVHTAAYTRIYIYVRIYVCLYAYETMFLVCIKQGPRPEG